jgi:hypothetical protein
MCSVLFIFKLLKHKNLYGSFMFFSHQMDTLSPSSTFVIPEGKIPTMWSTSGELFQTW